MTASYETDRRRAAKARIWCHVAERHGDERQRRTHTGITCPTPGCSAGIDANASSTTQSMVTPGSADARSLATGRLWTTSPSDDVFTSSTRGMGELCVCYDWQSLMQRHSREGTTL